MNGLRARMEELGVSRALVVCGNTIATSPLLAQVREQLGDAFAAVYPGAVNQTPLASLEGGFELALASRADVIISLGGGSAIDTGKGIALLSITGKDYLTYCHNPQGVRLPSAPALPRGGLAHIAIPTTAGSASETLPTAGMRDPVHGRKLVFRDTRLIPDIALLDPLATIYSGPELTASSGMTSIARCVEAFYSSNRNPLSTALALEGLRLLHGALPRAVRDPHDIDARSDCLAACALSGIAAGNALPSLVHGVGHIVGGRYGLRHGTAHGLLLAPAMRLLLPICGDTRIEIARALGARDETDAQAAGELAASRMDVLLEQLPLPRRLRDVGVPREELEGIARHMPGEFMMRYMARPIEAEEILAFLTEAW
jgi:alcohol dehydrogenase class IV